jgi:hypothetical protein
VGTGSREENASKRTIKPDLRQPLPAAKLHRSRKIAGRAL